MLCLKAVHLIIAASVLKTLQYRYNIIHIKVGLIFINSWAGINTGIQHFKVNKCLCKMQEGLIWMLGQQLCIGKNTWASIWINMVCHYFIDAFLSYPHVPNICYSSDVIWHLLASNLFALVWCYSWHVLYYPELTQDC